MRPSKARRTLAAAAVAAKDPEEEAKEINERLRASQEPRKGWWSIGIQTDRFQSDSVHVICSMYPFWACNTFDSSKSAANSDGDWKPIKAPSGFIFLKIADTWSLRSLHCLC